MGHHRTAAVLFLMAAALLPGSLPAGALGPADVCEGAQATIIGTDGDDVLVGTAGPDVIVGLDGDDVIRGRGGDDIVCAGSGDDVVAGGGGDDRILGGPGADVLRGRAGHDSLHGQAGDDWLIGNRGDDQLNGGRDLDACDGSAGNDRADPQCDLTLGVESVEPTCDLLPFADLRHCDLTNANLDGLDLTGANLSGVSATGVSMVGTILDGADLSSVELSARFNAASGASFVGANLTGAHVGSLAGEDLDFTDADMSGLMGDGARNSASQGIVLTDVTFIRTNLSGAQFGNRSATLNADFTDANLRGFSVDFISGTFHGADVADMTVSRLEALGLAGRTVERLTCRPVGRFRSSGEIVGAFNNTAFVDFVAGDCNIVGDFTGTSFADATFISSDGATGSRGTWRSINLSNVHTSLHTWSLSISDSDLTGWTADPAWWQDFSIESSDLSGWSGHVAMTEGSISDSDMSGWSLEAGMYLRNVALDAVDLTGTPIDQAEGVTWTNVTCPDGTNSDDNGGTCEGHLQP